MMGQDRIDGVLQEINQVARARNAGYPLHTNDGDVAMSVPGRGPSTAVELHVATPAQAVT
jgi:hypothetical protein